ncbi:MAG: response regulator transcription factor, partial [Blastococcus sp.]
MSERPLRVAIAEDHYLVREGVRQLLELGGEVEVVAAVGTAIELHATLAERAADVVVTDIRMPPGHHVEGIEAAHA